MNQLSMTDLAGNALSSTRKLFRYYKQLGENAIEQVPDFSIHYAPNDHLNSIAIIVKHLAGNMQSRFTDFLTSDGEKSWRNREDEFVDDFEDKTEMMKAWNKGWAIVFSTLDHLKNDDLMKTVYIRNEGHTVLEALQRQLSHYSYHIGQIVYLARLHTGEDWKYLSIPPGKTDEYNKKKFSRDKSRGMYTDRLDEES